jgi:1-deoxy-D-xylulose-5-phosphate synthase
MRFLKPLDADMVEKLASRSTHFAVLEENSAIGGLGSAVIDHLNTKGLNLPVLKIALPDAFVPHGNMKALYKEIGFDTPTLTEKIRRFYKEGQR